MSAPIDNFIKLPEAQEQVQEQQQSPKTKKEDLLTQKQTPATVKNAMLERIEAMDPEAVNQEAWMKQWMENLKAM